MRGVDPSSPQDQMLGAGGTDGLLAGKLGFAVHAEWRRLRVLAIWRCALPVEDVIGGVMHKRHTIDAHQAATTPGAVALARVARSRSCSARSTAV